VVDDDGEHGNCHVDGHVDCDDDDDNEAIKKKGKKNWWSGYGWKTTGGVAGKMVVARQCLSGDGIG
jgi:hypothetical protein